MFEQMRRQFEDVAQSWGQQGWSDEGGGGEGTSGLPAGGMGSREFGIDLADQGDAFEVTADLPGFEEDEIDVRVDGETLHVSARSERSSDDQEGDVIRSERRQRSMSRSVTLPAPVEEEGGSAQYRNGVLTVTLPKREESDRGGHHIAIES